MNLGIPETNFLWIPRADCSLEKFLDCVQIIIHEELFARWGEGILELQIKYIFSV